jgi:hypothetical protein
MCFFSSVTFDRRAHHGIENFMVDRVRGVNSPHQRSQHRDDLSDITFCIPAHDSFEIPMRQAQPEEGFSKYCTQLKWIDLASRPLLYFSAPSGSVFSPPLGFSVRIIGFKIT